MLIKSTFRPKNFNDVISASKFKVTLVIKAGFVWISLSPYKFTKKTGIKVKTLQRVFPVKFVIRFATNKLRAGEKEFARDEPRGNRAENSRGEFQVH